MKTIWIVAVWLFATLMVHGQDRPRIVLASPPNGVKTDQITITVMNLQNTLVSSVVLAGVGHVRYPVEVTDQSSKTIKFKIPDVLPGRLAITIAKSLCCRFFLDIDEQGNFQIDDTYHPKATDRTQAVQWLQEQNDIVMGKSARTLALIDSVTSWYKVDPTHPKAITESEQLREFYASLTEEYSKLLGIYSANKTGVSWSGPGRQVGCLAADDVVLLTAAGKASNEVEGKMRRLKAMGFQ